MFLAEGRDGKGQSRNPSDNSRDARWHDGVKATDSVGGGGGAYVRTRLVFNALELKLDAVLSLLCLRQQAPQLFHLLSHPDNKMPPEIKAGFLSRSDARAHR